jgi:hypothetical protein
MTDVVRLSPSIAKILLDKSPKHAWLAHRLLGGQANPKKTQSMLLGNSADVATLGVEAKPDGKKKRKAPAREAKAKAISDAVKSELTRRGIIGVPQYRVEWTSILGVECSGYIDLNSSQDNRFWDLKTSHDLSDYNITYQIEKYRYDMQVAAYSEATGKEPWFIFAESAAPYDVRFVNVTPRMLKQGLETWHEAAALWQRCLQLNNWPGRGDFTADVSAWRQKQAAEEWLKDSGIE